MLFSTIRMNGVYLGIDYGEKRIGLAISDEGGKLAFPKAVLSNDKALLMNIKGIIEGHDVKTVVIGESKDLKGVKNPIMDNIERFKRILEKEIGIEVIYEPEFLTSHHAAQEPANIPNLDASAAALILQSFLDKKNERNRNLSR